MSKEIRDFERQMKSAFKILEGKSERVVQNTFIELFADIIKDTPVGDPSLWNSSYFPSDYIPGTLKGNWQTNIDALPTSFLEDNQDASGTSTISSMKMKVKQWNVNESLYFANNAPYVQAIEFGYSSQAPEGMYRTNLMRFNGLLSKYAKSENK